MTPPLLQCHIIGMTTIRTVCVYCGSGSGTNPRFIEAAQALGICASTADNDWAYARCWLRVEIEGRAGRDGEP